MVDFEDRKETKEEKEKRVFEETYSKQSKAAKKVMTIVFGILGAVFLVAGIIMFCFRSYDEELIISSLVFIFLGALYLVLGLIFKKVIPEKIDFEKYKKRKEKYGYSDTTSLSIQVGVLEKKIEELEERIEQLEKDERRL